MATNSNSSEAPLQQLLPPPPGFPSALIGRTLHVAEFFHAFLPALLGEKEFHEQQQQQEEADAAVTVGGDEGAPGPPSARRLFAALAARNDLESYMYVYGHLTVLLKCLDRHKLEQPGQSEGGSEAEEAKWARRMPRRRFAMELVRLALRPGQGSVANVTSDVALVARSLETTDYHELDVQQRLVLFEGLVERLLQFPAFRSRCPSAPLGPQARLSSGGGQIWWRLRCAPDCLLVETPAAVSLSTAAADPRQVAETDEAATSTWRCFTSPDDLEALRRTAQGPDLARFHAVIDDLAVRERRQQLRPPATAEVAYSVSDYLLASFINALISSAELLYAEPPGVCMDPDHLRHRLTRSTRVSELADCLLLFEDQLPRCLRQTGQAAKQWRDSVRKAGTVARLNFLLRRLPGGEWVQGFYKEGGKHGVCCVCSRHVLEGWGRRALFCHGCCRNFHPLCVPPALGGSSSAAAADVVSAAVSAADSTADVSRGLWLCDGCKEVAKPPVAPAAIGADNGGAEPVLAAAAVVAEAEAAVGHAVVDHGPTPAKQPRL